MARMRTLKPEAATSETLSDVDRGIRWTFGCFWTHCDDEGRAVWNLRLIKAAIYPLDDSVTVAVLERDFAELERVGAVCMYEIDGKRYLHVPSWSEHQHPNRKLDSKLPPCPKQDHSPTPHAQRSEHAVSTNGALIPVVVEEGLVEGEETGRNSAARALAIVTDAPTAQTIVGEWIDRCAKRPPETVIGQTSKAIRAMLAEGIDPTDVRRGLAAWMSKGLHPSSLPSVVNEVMNSQPRAGAQARQQDETDAMFERAARRLGVTS